jgi:hypothetical protein
MPPVSQAQRKAMYAAAEGKSTLGIPQSVGDEFTEADKPGKLPARKKAKKKRGDGLKSYAKGLHKRMR